MDLLELSSYLEEISDYIEYSFYKNSSEIMGAISKRGFADVFQILSLNEVSRGIFKCATTWNINDDVTLKKDVTIDISGEVVFITENVNNTNGQETTIDIEKEYGDILQILRKKRLSGTEKQLLVKVVKAFIED